MNDKELKAIKERRDAITPGVWYVELRESSYYYGVFYNATVTTGTDDIAGLGAEEQCHADAAFIAAAPADIDALLADNVDLRRQVADLEELLRREEARS